ncbi:MAG: protein kinase, partial [Verrucomicrobiota bacterium]
MSTASRVEKLFSQLLKLPESRREAFLAEMCGQDPVLRRQLEGLLHAAGQTSSAPPNPDLENAETVLATTPLTEIPGATIGRYKLLELLGEGGFGSVWAAEQKEPVKRRVALKIIKLGMDTREVVARFEAERQALALMDHPNIARVFDGGMTETGRP